MAFRDHKEIIFTHIREISIDKIKIKEVNNKILKILQMVQQNSYKEIQYESFIMESQMTRFVLFQFCLSMRTVLIHRNGFVIGLFFF